MIDKNKSYRTRDGREVRIYATDGGNEYKVHGAVRDNGIWLPQAWLSDGKALYFDEHDADLIEIRPRIKRTVWLNVYDNEVIHGGWRTKEEADRISHGNRVACIKLDLDCAEGDGL